MSRTGSSGRWSWPRNVWSATNVRNGIVNTVMTLVTAARVTHSGTSPRDANVYAFDVMPLGQIARMTSPTATVGAGPKIQASANAVSGRPNSCAASPTPAALG